MEENIVETTEAEQTSDAFLEGWDEADTAVLEADQPEEQPVEETESTQEEETTQEAPMEEMPAADADSEAEAPALPQNGEPAPTMQPAAQRPVPPQTFQIRHMDDPVLNLTAEEMVPLAEKGRDYDRVRGLYEQARPILRIFESAAQEQDMSLEDFTAMVRQNLIESEGASPELARRIVAMENRQLQPYEQTQSNEFTAQYEPPVQQEDRAEREVREFQRNFPDAQEVPQEVWDDVIGNGTNLTAAYSIYLARKADATMAEVRRKEDAAVQNQSNAARSTGSLQSAGQQKKSNDPFLDGFNE